MKVAIAGFGLEGRINYSYFRQRYPESELVIADERTGLDNLPFGVKTILGPDAFRQLDDFDIVVRTASLAPRKITTQGKIWSGTNEFFAKCPAQIIGVTGTKGKGTTCSLITSILQVAGRKVHLVGNIGTPALEVLSDIHPDDIVVYELSSFQLWDLEISPQVAVVLMIEPDHLDIHSDFEEYLQAKAHIADYQTSVDSIIYHPANQYSRAAASGGQAKKQRFGIVDDGGVYVDSGRFYAENHAICSVEALHLVGHHNLDNACAAITAVYAIDSDISDEEVAEGLSSFRGLDHRLKFVAEIAAVKYYDDSIATTPGSVIAAIKSFKQPKVLLLGGAEKGSDYTEMIEQIVLEENQVKAVVLLGSNAERLAGLFGEYQTDLIIDLQGVRPMTEVVQAASGHAQAGDVVILSPAATSFDMFDNYQDRGNKFSAAVKELAN